MDYIEAIASIIGVTDATSCKRSASAVPEGLRAVQYAQ